MRTKATCCYEPAYLHLPAASPDLRGVRWRLRKQLCPLLLLHRSLNFGAPRHCKCLLGGGRKGKFGTGLSRVIVQAVASADLCAIARPRSFCACALVRLRFALGCSTARGVLAAASADLRASRFPSFGRCSFGSASLSPMFISCCATTRTIPLECFNVLRRVDICAEQK